MLRPHLADAPSDPSHEAGGLAPERGKAPGTWICEGQWLGGLLGRHRIPPLADDLE